MSGINKLSTLVHGFEYGALKKQGVFPSTTMFYKLPKGTATKLTYQDYIDKLKNNTLDLYKPVDPKYQPYWWYRNLEAEPVIVDQGCVYELMVTTEFTKLRVRTINLLLGYYAMAQHMKLEITKVGLILPCQNLVKTVDLNGWDSSKYMELLVEESVRKNARDNVPSELLFQYATLAHNIGSHVTRNRLLRPTLDVLEPTQPIQIFLGSRLKHEHNFSDEDVAQTLATIQERGQRVFTHATYTINLARPNSVVPLLKQCMTTKAYGGQGTVVHLGKKVDLKLEDAMKNMYDNVAEVASQCSPESPLLLETDSGGSLYDNPADLADFWLSLPEDAKKGSGICLDTCHVFAAGYDNMESLKMFESKEVPVKLIHYNDSVYDKGSKLDRHADIGHGKVGLGELIKVAEWAVARGIALVRE